MILRLGVHKGSPQRNACFPTPSLIRFCPHNTLFIDLITTICSSKQISVLGKIILEMISIQNHTYEN